MRELGILATVTMPLSTVRRGGSGYGYLDRHEFHVERSFIRYFRDQKSTSNEGMNVRLLIKDNIQWLLLNSLAGDIKWFRLKHILSSVGIIITLFVYSGASNAQSVEFADDFSVDSLEYHTSTSFEGANSGGISIENGGVRFIAASVGDGESSARLSVVERTNSFSISGKFDPDATIIDNENSWVQVNVVASLFNDINPDEREFNSRLGDINLSVNSSVFADGSVNLFVCFGREGVEGYEELLLFENNSRHCKDYSTTSLSVGSTFELGVSTAESGMVNISAAGQSDTIGLPGTLFSSVSYSRALQVFTQGMGTGSFLLNSVTTDAGTDDFTVSPPVLNRYRINHYPRDGEIPRVENERVLITQQSQPDNGSAANLELQSVTDYLETTMELSSQSNIAESGFRVGGYLELVPVNDTQDGGFDGRVGDIRANIWLDARHDGLRRAEYCLYRYEEADGSERTGLLLGGEERCINFPINIEFDTPYRVAINFDRSNSSVTFRLDGFTHTEELGFQFFDAAQPRSRLEIGSRNGALVVGYLDDIRNGQSALTATEIVQGLTAPSEFPPQPSAEELQVASALDAPFDYSGPISFVDDFSHGTTPFGLSRWPRETTSSTIGYFDGAIEIQSASGGDDPNRGSNTEFHINSQGDEIRTVVSLSSRSMIAPGNGEVSLDLRATFYNDTQDGGFNGREGDVNANLRIKVRGDGRREITADLRRRDADGDNENLELFDGDDRHVFDLIPELDTPYELVIRLDRDQNMMTFSVDNLVREVLLPTTVFEPAQRSVALAAWHQGGSGRSIIRIHSVSIGDFAQDFASQAPVIAPYYPAWNARHPGVTVEVVDGRARLESDGRVTSGRNADISSQGISDYVGGLLELSSESEIAADGAIAAELSGILYHEVPPENLDDRTGAVFAATRLTATGTGERFVQVCAWRSDDDSFGSSMDLISGQSGTESFTVCQRLQTDLELDVAYPASVSVDRDSATLTYTFADEVFTYNIGTDIHSPARQFSGVRARTTDNSKVVAYVDNLSFAENPTPLALSDNSLGQDISGFVNNGSNAANASSSGSTSVSGGSGSTGGGGGGCTISRSGSVFDPMMLLLVFISLVTIVSRRRKY